MGAKWKDQVEGDRNIEKDGEIWTKRRVPWKGLRGDWGRVKKIVQRPQHAVGQPGDLATALTNKGNKSHGEKLQVSASLYLHTLILSDIAPRFYEGNMSMQNSYSLNLSYIAPHSTEQ